MKYTNVLTVVCIEFLILLTEVRTSRGQFDDFMSHEGLEPSKIYLYSNHCCLFPLIVVFAFKILDGPNFGLWELVKK